MLKARLMGLLVAAAAAGIAVLLGSLYALSSADRAGQDIQPVDFSHELHAGRLQLACLFCHRHADKSRVAGIPSLSLCMSCHQSMEQTGPETAKLLAYWNEKQPIPWRRLQRSPDFIYFTHDMHLKGGLSCTDCHGRVEQMRFTPRAATNEMGWCLTCHQERGASTDCLTCHK